MIEWILSLFAGWPQIGSEPAASVQAYAGATQALLTVALTPITIFAAWMARNAWVTAASQRHDALMPLLELKLARGSAPNTLANLECRLENIGLGPALNVRPSIAQSSGGDQYLTLEDPNGGIEEPPLIPVGKSHTFSLLDRRLIAVHRSFMAELRSRGKEFATQAEQNDLNARWEAARQPILATPASLVIRVQYRDVYKRSFAVEAPLVPVHDDDDNGRPGRITLGSVSHTFPHR